MIDRTRFCVMNSQAFEDVLQIDFVELLEFDKASRVGRWMFE
jgi:hypothetical protein